MKILHEKYYQYLGEVGQWHAFKCTKQDFDPEIIFLQRAKMEKIDGSVVYFDPIRPTASFSFRRSHFGDNILTASLNGKELEQVLL